MAKVRGILTKDNLQQLHWRDGKSFSNIARMFSVTEGTVRYWMRKYGIPKNSQSLATILSMDALYRLYNEFGFSILEIAKMYDVSTTAVYNLMEKYTISRRTYSESRKGERNGNWKGGKIPRVCEFCGNRFLVCRAEIDKGSGIFCSRSCVALYYFMRKPKSWTSIEKLVYRFLLSKFGLSFVPQYPIPNYGIADFYNPNLRIIVECQGDYWHNLEKQRERDRLKRFNAQQAGYQLVELWEDDIKERFT